MKEGCPGSDYNGIVPTACSSCDFSYDLRMYKNNTEICEPMPKCKCPNGLVYFVKPGEGCDIDTIQYDTICKNIQYEDYMDEFDEDYMDYI